MSKALILDEESHFGIEELFFSHTDKKGRILYGNDVFVRVSEYSFEELENRPHNIIRHPSMPKAVFKILWDTILDNEPVVAYVKNKSKHGKFYWVIALVFPFKDGFLSIRIKPTSKIMEHVDGLYEKTLSLEKKSGLESSIAFLLSEISNLGFPDYPSFMVSALVEEIRSRASKLEINRFERQGSVVVMLESSYNSCIELDKASRKLYKEFAQLKLLSINMLINTEQYGEDGRAISVTSQTFSKWGEEVRDKLELFINKQEEFNSGSSKARFSFCIALLQTEMADFFRASENASEIYIKDLDVVAKKNIDTAKRAVFEMAQLFKSFVSSVKNLNESLLAFKIVKLNSRVEAAHLPDGGLKIEATVSDTTNFISLIEESSERIKQQVSELSGLVDKVSKQAEALR